MPENKPAVFAESLHLFHADDELFGDFKSVPSFASSLPALAPNTSDANGGCEIDDDWGDFVAITAPPPSLFKVPSGSADVSKPWEKPNGALPLSIFGEEDSEVELPDGNKVSEPVEVQSVFHNRNALGSLSNGVGTPSGGGRLVDLIADLYQKAASEVSGSADSSEDDSWEFKAASSVEVGFNGDKSVMGTNGVLNGTEVQGFTNLWTDHQHNKKYFSNENGCEKFTEYFPDKNGHGCETTASITAIKPPQPSTDFVNMEAVTNFDNIDWEFQEVSELTSSNQEVICGTVQPLSACSSLPNLLIGYSRFKELSLLLVVQHLHDIQRKDGLSSLDGKLAKKVELNKEIQAACGQETSEISSNYLRTYPSRDLLVNQLFELIKEPQFEYFELEYFLSKTISSAKEDLCAAITVFEHAVLVIRILRLASLEEQKAYIKTWSEVANASARELAHGAKIWEESLLSNISEQIISKGACYFVALGEIYHVIKILQASLKLYMPWILVNKFHSNDLLVLMEKCHNVWMTCGLENALGSIATTIGFEFSSRCRILLEAIASIDCLNDQILLEYFLCEKQLCRLSLLPVGVLQDTVPVVWEGEHYFLKLVNLWVNLVSCDLPQLPRIHVG